MVRCAFYTFTNTPSKTKYSLAGIYFSTEDLINKAVALLNNKKERCDLGVQARRHIVKHYDLHAVCRPQHIAMIEA